MDTLIGTALGAVIGVTTTLIAERARWNREHSSREKATKREVYGAYLGAMSLTLHHLRALRREEGLTREVRISRVGQTIAAEGAYNLRYQVVITAPDQLGELAEHAFACLRAVRDRFDTADVGTDPGWDPAFNAADEALKELRVAMRSDLERG